jgi:hypothetical protein
LFNEEANFTTAFKSLYFYLPRTEMFVLVGALIYYCQGASTLCVAGKEKNELIQIATHVVCASLNFMVAMT